MTKLSKIARILDSGKMAFLVMSDGNYVSLDYDRWEDKDEYIKDRFGLDEYIHLNDPDLDDVDDLVSELKAQYGPEQVFCWYGYYEVYICVCGPCGAVGEVIGLSDALRLYSVWIHDKEHDYEIQDGTSCDLFEDAFDAIAPGGYTEEDIIGITDNENDALEIAGLYDEWLEKSERFSDDSGSRLYLQITAA